MRAITIIPKSDEEYSLVMAMLKQMRIKATTQPLQKATKESVDEPARDHNPTRRTAARI